MDTVKLKRYAELLEEMLAAQRGENADIEWLKQYPPLLSAIADAKAGTIEEPRNIGLDRWELESDIQSFPDLAGRLAEFEFLLEGSELPSDED